MVSTRQGEGNRGIKDSSELEAAKGTSSGALRHLLHLRWRRDNIQDLSLLQRSWGRWREAPDEVPLVAKSKRAAPSGRKRRSQFKQPMILLLRLFLRNSLFQNRLCRFLGYLFGHFLDCLFCYSLLRLHRRCRRSCKFGELFKELPCQTTCC